MILLTIEEKSYINKVFAIYVKKNLVLMIKNTRKSRITVITLEHIEALLIMFLI